MESTQNSDVIYATPSKFTSSSTICNEIYLNCDDERRPHLHLGMTFDSLQEVVDFYKQYAYHVGFSVDFCQEPKKWNCTLGVLCFFKQDWHKEIKRNLS